jgi:hypothetical protein
MVPDDIVRPPHRSIEISDLTPQERPEELTDDLWELIEECATEEPGFNATEIHECLTEGACSEKIEQDRDVISLPMVLFVLAAEQSESSAAFRSNRRSQS